jgi:flavin-dependent dehydrogenase
METGSKPSTGPHDRRAKSQECDVFVIGGSPASSTTAALLAQAGRNVVVLEKDTLPRFHIGESLLSLIFLCSSVAA